MKDSGTKIYKVKIVISGFTKEQIKKGVPDLLDEFTHRPWLFETEALYDEGNCTLVVILGYEIDFRLEDGAYDEILECITATMNFDKEVSFDIQRI